MKSKFDIGFHTLNTWEKIKEYGDYLMENDAPRFELLAFDTETSGLYFYKNVIIGFSISTNSKSGMYLPLLNWKSDLTSKKTKKIDGVETEVYENGHFECAWTKEIYQENVTLNEYQPPQAIKDYLTCWCTNTNLLMHNGPFDCNMVSYNYGIDLSPNLFCDTRLLKHYIDESTKTGLKDTAVLWSKDLGFNAEEEANKEQVAMKASVLKNGAKDKGHVWRADADLVSVYAAKDTALTYGLYEVGMKKLKAEYGQKGMELFFDKEIMPLCREVVIPMQQGGVKIDVEHFIKLKSELIGKINAFEDSAIRKMGSDLEGFSIGQTMEDISERAIIEKIIELEGLAYPVLIQKGLEKPSLSKPAVKKMHEKDPHWLWGYILGQNEFQYNSIKMSQIKSELYREKSGRRYSFNLNSDQHLRWLLFEKLINDPRAVPQTDSATKEKPIPSLAAEVLEEHFKNKYEFIADVMMFRKLGDLLGNYVEKAIALNNKGWLHMDMDQAGTTSGRFSCRGGFNLQTLPKVENLSNCPKCESKNVSVNKKGTVLSHLKCNNCKHEENNIICYSVIKEGFVAPEGYKIVTSDYSSLEPRAFASTCGDPKLIEIYTKGYDFYSKIYCDVEDDEGRYSPDPKDANYLKKVNPELRQSIKAPVLAIPYGSLGPQVANLMGFKKTEIDRKTGAKKEYLDVKRGEAWREKYLNAYPELRKYMEKSELDASTRGYVETKMGRRRHYKYAPIIQEILNHRGVNKEDFLNFKRKDLDNEKIDLGEGLFFKDLEWFCSKTGMFISNVKEKGLWAYIRGIYKNELDNAKNVQIQGLAGHICNRAMLETTRYFKAALIDGYIALQVHDSIISYVREDQAQIGAELLQRGMEKNIFAKEISVPLEAIPVICGNLKDEK